MHSFVWGETYPDFMDALMPLACLPVQIAGRNRIWRKMVMDAIRSDPAWTGGEYVTQPREGVAHRRRSSCSSPAARRIRCRRRISDREIPQTNISTSTSLGLLGVLDANDLLYQVNASRNYDPSDGLDKIIARLMWVNSADDFINPPELGIAEQEARKLKNGRFVLIPISDQTHGHGTHTRGAVWSGYLQELLATSRDQAAKN